MYIYIYICVYSKNSCWHMVSITQEFVVVIVDSGAAATATIR
jgi:hypothetical protein